MYNRREKLIIAFEVLLMVVQFVNIFWMIRFMPSNMAEWLINFFMFVYVFYEAFTTWNKKRLLGKAYSETAEGSLAIAKEFEGTLMDGLEDES